MKAVMSHIEKIKYDMATLSKQNDVKRQSLNRLCQIIDDVKVQMGTSDWHTAPQATAHGYKKHE